jgi:hypothetical protein
MLGLETNLLFGCQAHPPTPQVPDNFASPDVLINDALDIAWGNIPVPIAAGKAEHVASVFVPPDVAGPPHSYLRRESARRQGRLKGLGHWRSCDAAAYVTGSVHAGKDVVPGHRRVGNTAGHTALMDQFKKSCR